MRCKPFLNRDDRARLEGELTDPRTYLFSCFDLGGTNAADDWMFALAGQGQKYELMGLNICRSRMYDTRLVARLWWAFLVDGRRQAAWGNLRFTAVYSDRVVLTTPFWGSARLALNLEILLVRPGCCRLLFELRNLSAKPARMAFDAALQGANLASVRLTGARANLALDEGFFIIEARRPGTALVPPGGFFRITAQLAAAQNRAGAVAGLRRAACVNTADFRRCQRRCAHPGGLDLFKAPADRKLALKVFNDLRSNLLDYRDTYFSAPNRVVHKGQWLWDTCFHAFAWSLFDPARVKTLLANLFIHQDERTGFVPITVESGGVTMDCTQPPLAAFAVSELVHDRAFLRGIYPQLARFNAWLEHDRRLPNGLYCWRNAGESGMDNSPRFDRFPGRPTTARHLNRCGVIIERNVAHIDFSSMMALQYLSLAALAERLRLRRAAAVWRKQHQSLAAKINAFLYHPRDGFYYDRTLDGRWLRVKTVASFWPLVAGVARPRAARQLVRHLMNPAEFFTPFPVPSVAAAEPSFCFNYWRGPVWINTCFMVVLGLKKYGFRRELRLIGERVVAGVRRELEHSGQLWELYDPFGGPAAAMEKKYAGPRENAAHFAGWTANVLNILCALQAKEAGLIRK